MLTFTPTVDGDPSAEKPKSLKFTVMPKGYDPFAQSGAPRQTMMPKGFDPFKPAPAKSAARVSADGGAAVRAIFPRARITSQHRTNNIGPANDWHHRSNAAVDVEPIEGMTFDQFTGKLRDAGYPIIQAIDEVNHPSKWSTGPHWHVVLGGHESGLSWSPNPEGNPPKQAEELTFTPNTKQPRRLTFTVMPDGFDPFKAPAKGTAASRPRGSPAASNRAQQASSAAAAPEKELGLGEALWKGAKNIPKSAKDTAVGLYEAARHPVNTAEGIGEFAGGGLATAMDTLHVPGVNERGKRAEAKFRSAVDPWLKHPYATLKKNVAEDPVGTALTIAPMAGGARLAGKLGLRGVDAARLAGMTDAERTALRARRAADAAHASKYQGLQREVVGKHSLDRDRALATLQKHQRVVGNAPVEDQRAIVAAVESNNGRDVAKLPEKYRPAAVELRAVAKAYRTKIEEVLRKDDGSGPSFVQDYYAHLWKQDKKDAGFFSGGSQGSGRNLKRRTIPTLSEGIERGLTPLHENPLDTMSAYVENMSKFLQGHDLRNRMRTSGLAKWAPEHSIPEDHVPLNGTGTVKDALLTRDAQGNPAGLVGRRVLVAPRKAAVMYNRFVDPGVEAKLKAAGKTGQAAAFRLARGATNATSNLVLAFSGFHPTLVAGKSVASDLGNAITHTFRGQPVEAIKSLAHAPIAPLRPLVDRLAGKVSMKGRLLSGDEAMTHIDKLWRDAGGRLKSDSSYRASLRPNLITSFRRGTFKRDVLEAARNIAGKDRSFKERLGATADAVGRIMDTSSSAIFDHFVPAMKRQAFEREMAANLKPGMDEAAQKALARRVMDNVSGRMGELERDNIFWSQARSDILRLVILSPSWQYGDFKILNDAAGSSASGHGVAQAAGLVASYYLMNGIANYLHTGQRPVGQDWVAYRTGGTTADRSGVHPERATFPSVMKDVFGFPADPLGEARNKMAPLPRALSELATNSDWRSQPIYRPIALAPEDLPPDAPDNLKGMRGLAALGHLAGSFSPIGMQDNPNGPNTGISRAGQIVFGERPAGQRFYDPEGYESFQRYTAKQRVEAEARAKRRDEAKRRARVP